jgi:hypothetical protein
MDACAEERFVPDQDNAIMLAVLFEEIENTLHCRPREQTVRDRDPSTTPQRA